MKTQAKDNMLDLGQVGTMVATASKRLVIGDIHGHIEPFKSIYEKEEPDDVIILGDYFDSFHGTDQEIIDCFKQLLEMQKNHTRGEFILLIGNHDFHYMDLSECYSGKRKSYAITVSMMLDDAIEKKQLQYFYIDDTNKMLFSHAGVTNSWLKNNRLFIDTLHDLEAINLDDKMKFTFKSDNRHIERGYGTGIYASPIWVRPMTLIDGMYKDSFGHVWTQYVGHTHSRLAESWVVDSNGDFIKRVGPITYTDKDDTLLFVLDSLPSNYLVQYLVDGVVVRQDIIEHNG